MPKDMELEALRNQLYNNLNLLSPKKQDTLKLNAANGGDSDLMNISPPKFSHFHTKSGGSQGVPCYSQYT